MGWGTIGEVRDGSGDHRGGPGQVGRPTGRFGTGQKTLGEIRDRSEDPRGGPGTGRETLREV